MPELSWQCAPPAHAEAENRAKEHFTMAIVLSHQHRRRLCETRAYDPACMRTQLADLYHARIVKHTSHDNYSYCLVCGFSIVQGSDAESACLAIAMLVNKGPGMHSARIEVTATMAELRRQARTEV